MTAPLKPRTCKCGGVLPEFFPDGNPVCSCRVLYGARHRKTGEWARDFNGPNMGKVSRYETPGEVWNWSNSPVGMAEFLDTYRIVRTRKVRKPKPSVRLAAWQARRSLARSVAVWASKGIWRAKANCEWETSGPTPAAAMRALVKAMGKAVDE